MQEQQLDQSTVQTTTPASMEQTVYTWSTRDKSHKSLPDTLLELSARGEQITAVTPMVMSNFPGNVSKILDAVIVTVKWN